MNRKIASILICLAVSNSAYAGFQVVDVPKAKKVSTSNSEGTFLLSGYDRVLYKGQTAETPAVVHGMGKSVAISAALKQIMQFGGWHGYAKPGVNKDTKVTWHGGKPWVAVLNDMLAQTGDMATVDWNTRSITLMPEGEGRNLSVKAAPVLAKAAPVVDYSHSASAAIAKPAPKPKPEWEMTPQDGTLKVVLTKWARMAGWQVSWEVLDNNGHAADYPIQMYAKIDGSFEQAVSKVMDSLSNTDTPAKAIFYNGNRVLRVVAASGNK